MPETNETVRVSAVASGMQLPEQATARSCAVGLIRPRCLDGANWKCLCRRASIWNWKMFLGAVVLSIASISLNCTNNLLAANGLAISYIQGVGEQVVADYFRVPASGGILRLPTSTDIPATGALQGEISGLVFLQQRITFREDTGGSKK